MADVMYFQLTIQLLSEWHIGAGRDGGAYADSLVIKDEQSLPQISGKSIKGLLRQACVDVVSYGWLEGTNKDDIDVLFGTEGSELSAQGAIRVGSATFGAAEKTYFQQNPAAIDQLFRVRHFTAIDHDTGTAKSTSLRAIEVVVPMTLAAPVALQAASVSQAQKFKVLLEAALPLITAVGGKRHRGFGEAIFNLSSAKEAH